MEEDQEAEKHHLVDIVVTEPDASIVYSGLYFIFSCKLNLSREQS